VHSLDLAHNTVTLLLPGANETVPVGLSLSLTARHNAKQFYSTRKKTKEKEAKTKAATEKALKKAEKQAKI